MISRCQHILRSFEGDCTSNVSMRNKIIMIINSYSNLSRPNTTVQVLIMAKLNVNFMILTDNNPINIELKNLRRKFESG